MSFVIWKCFVSTCGMMISSPGRLVARGELQRRQVALDQEAVEIDLGDGAAATLHDDVAAGAAGRIDPARPDQEVEYGVLRRTEVPAGPARATHRFFAPRPRERALAPLPAARGVIAPHQPDPANAIRGGDRARRPSGGAASEARHRHADRKGSPSCHHAAAFPLQADTCRTQPLGRMRHAG